MPLLESPPNISKPRKSQRTPTAKSSPKRNPLRRKAAAQPSGEEVAGKNLPNRTTKRYVQSSPRLSDSCDCDEASCVLLIKADVKSRACKQKVPSKLESDAVLSRNEPRLPKTKCSGSPRKEKSKMTEAELREDSPVTPTKQRRSNENDPHTPSHLLNKLSLKSPSEFEPKKLFSDDPSVYQSARRALHSTCPPRMPGREPELNELQCFIQKHLEMRRSGTLYISGPPGTGKTALLSMVLNDHNFASEFKHVYINCTGVKSSGAIFSRIVKELDCKTSGKSEKDCIAGVETYLSRSQKMILLVLDEIDQLESKKQSILYKIFEWPSKLNSNLILIGIANALDLTDRVLPRLQARCELKLQLMHFAPYTKEQIVRIITERLQQAKVLDVFAPVAIQMLAGKVAAVSGDVRRALDIGRRVIELVERNNNKSEVLKPLLENSTQAPKSSSSSRVDLLQVVNVLNKVYGTANNLSECGDDSSSSSSSSSSFPLQQKIVMCTLLLMLKKARNKDVTIGKLHEVYRRVCGKRNLLAVDQAEFVGVCSLIETKGIISVTGKREPRLHKVALNWDQEEVAAVLKDKQLTSSILQDDSCLGKL